MRNKIILIKNKLQPVISLKQRFNAGCIRSHTAAVLLKYLLFYSVNLQIATVVLCCIKVHKSSINYQIITITFSSIFGGILVN